ncbi:MAG TPA: YafY family protein [Blastocatellia bacterium]
MVGTSARLLRLLSLFQARRYWSGAELCARLEVTARTLRRDVDRLRTLGYPINSTSGTAGGYQLGAGATLPPLLLDDEEAIAVAVGLRTAASGSIDGIEESSVRALAKLEQVLPSRLGRRVAALHSYIVPLATGGPVVDASALATIASACRDHQSLRFSYRGRDGESSLRAVEPAGLVNTGRRWYMVAWDTNRRDWRTFRVDRIDMKATLKLSTGPRFVPRKPPDDDIAAYVKRSVAYTPYPFRAKVTLFAPYETLADRISVTWGVLEAIDERSCLLQTGAASLDMLASYLVWIGIDFKVVEPLELIDHLRLLAERFTRSAL